MASVRYLGSKDRVAEQIMGLITAGDEVFYDMFCGTGTMSVIAAKNNYKVVLNDNLICATILASSRLISDSEINFHYLGGYKAVINTLNNLKTTEGFIFNEYSPGGKNSANVCRKYFIPENAAKIDAIRNKIQDWLDGSYINEIEKNLILADLLEATDQVANIAGTYGCFLKDWQSNSLKPILLKPRRLHSHPNTYVAMNRNVFDLIPENGDKAVIYLDPPYTKRQYAAYYHILETISIWDSPLVEGVTGLRSWHEKASPFCYKSKALNSLLELINKLSKWPVYLSYSSAGHVPYEPLSKALSEIGEVTIFNLGEIGSYRSNKRAAENSSSVNEYLFKILPN